MAVPIIDFKHETVEYECSSFIVMDVGDQDKIRPLRRYPRTYDLIFVGDSNIRDIEDAKEDC